MVKDSILGTFLLILFVGFLSSSCESIAENTPRAEPFLGRWGLYLPGGAGWLEIRQEDGYLDGDILWYGGSVVPVGSIILAQDTLIVTRNQHVTREKDASGETKRRHTLTTWIELQRQGEDLVGTAKVPNRNGQGLRVVEFIGKRISPLPPAPDLSKLKFGEPITLFNGKDLNGWTLMAAKRVNGWKVENGVLINDPVQPEGKPHVRYGNLRTIKEFEDFNLKLQVNIPKGSNSGVYLRGIYEVQILDSYQKPLDSHNMGAIYSRITPKVAAEKPAGEWQDLDITLCDRHITVILNGKKIIDYQPLHGVTGGALTADEFSPGPIYLQGDHGRVLFKSIVLTPILK